MSEAIERIRYERDLLSLPQRTHVCLIYNMEHERRSSVSQFVNSALSKNDKFLYVTDATTESVLEWLDSPDTSEQGISDQFLIDGAKHVYCPCGPFVPEEMLSKLEKFNRISMKQGYRGFSGTGEMSWATRGWPGSENLIDYEAKLNKLVVERSLTVLCQYDVNRFDGGIILDVLRVHPKVLINGQVVENPFYKFAPVERQRTSATLEPTSRVLAELMLVQGLLYVFPSERKIGEFVCKALEKIPGCDSCVVYFQEDGRLTSAQETTSLPIYTDPFSFPEDLDGRITFPLTTSKRLYGYLIIEIQDQSLFKPYEPHIHTVANSIAITFENRWQQRELNSEIERHKCTAVELQEANDKLKDLVNTDPLTGLYNRRYFFQKTAEELVRSLRLEQDIVLTMIDFNNFKKVNDTLGHEEGNRLLKEFAEVTKNVLRETIDFVFRIGGDEFVILMGDCDHEKAEGICHRLNEEFCEITDIASLSYGIVEAPKNMEKDDITGDSIWLDKLLEIADQRMYKHKSSVKSKLAPQT